MIDLGDEAAQGSWRHIDLFTIERSTSSVNIETSKDFAHRFINTKHNLQVCGQNWSFWEELGALIPEYAGRDTGLRW